MAAIYFNECNNMKFYDLSRNREATSVYNLTSLLVLGPKFCPQIDKVTFKNSEDMIERLRRHIRTRWFILNNENADEIEESPKLHRKNINWELEKSSESLEGEIIRFEKILRIEFGTLQNRKSSNFINEQKISLNYM